MVGKLVCFGELLIDFVALERDTSVGYANQFEKAPGGAPANVAVGLAKLGLPTAFITQVGADPFGHFLAETLAENNVDVRGISYSQSARTALAFVAVEASGERSFAFYRAPSADMLMTSDQLNLNLLHDSTIFHFGSITLIDDPVKTTTLDAVQIAREHGALISYDPNLREVLWSSLDEARAGMLLGLAEANIVKMNEEELAFLQGTAPLTIPESILSAARDLWHDQLKLMLITRGKSGCVALTPETHWTHAGFSVVVEDTIGAGDGFMAGVLAGIAQHMTNKSFPDILHDDAMLKILALGNAVGALTASQRGGIPALPTMQAVEKFLDNQAVEG